ncbi:MULTISPECIES: hypothetical protein [Cysteiniphilum]|uniref:hypothetical protein n=1 Tax=Cysteiniphilum TaxID=2056696 RepID=UPI00177E365F|nr:MULTISPECIES: hypothetical protein [Cysteiniphilum]
MTARTILTKHLYHHPADAIIKRPSTKCCIYPMHWLQHLLGIFFIALTTLNLFCISQISFATTQSASMTLTVTARISQPDKLQLSNLNAQNKASLQPSLQTEDDHKMHFSNSNKRLQLQLAEPATIALASAATLTSLNSDNEGDFHKIPLQIFVNDIELDTSRLQLTHNQTHQIHITSETLNKMIEGYYHGVVLLNIHGVWD